MKQFIIILIVTFASITLGYWLGQMKDFADGVVEDIGKYTLKTDSSQQISKKENFDNFINKFHLDSSFQYSRIKFLDGRKWSFMKILGSQEFRTQVYDNFNKNITDSDERLLCLIGIENGIYSEYKFHRIDGLWYLVGSTDFSD